MGRNFTVDLPPTAWIGDGGPELVAGDVAAVPYLFTTTQRPALAFADGSDESAVLSSQFVMPSEYTGSGTLKLKLKWCCAVGDNTKKVNWEAYVEAISEGDGVDLSATSSFDTANDDGGSSCKATAYYENETIITLSNKDSVAAGDLVRLGIRRDTDDANDTAAGTAYILAAELYEET